MKFLIKSAVISNLVKKLSSSLSSYVPRVFWNDIFLCLHIRGFLARLGRIAYYKTRVHWHDSMKCRSTGNVSQIISTFGCSVVISLQDMALERTHAFI